MYSQTVLPAEWAPQSGVMLTWPHPHSDWQPWLTQADRNFLELTVQISLRESVIVNCYDDAHRVHVQNLLAVSPAKQESIRFFTIPSNDTWARDHGPITVYRDGRPILLNFRFNGWGDKYPFDLDNRITERLYEAGAFDDIPLENVDLILEGGGIETDGQGTLLTTRQCLLSTTRNGLSRDELEQRLAPMLGIKRFLWLNHGHLAGDDTDGHIDTLARFCNPETIAYQTCEDGTDEHFDSLKAMEEELQAFHTVAGKPYRLVPLPLPGARFDQDGKRLPASYANFLIINGAVLAPTYDDPADTLVLQRLQGCFPEREIVGVSCLGLILQYGSLHCVTMQFPAGVLRII